MSNTIRDFLLEATCRKEKIDHFLDQNALNCAKFDPELGYLLQNFIGHEGVDDSCAVYRFESSGSRKVINEVQQPCRINTYGNSFTQSSQVNDGESWQEYLAAHFCEPVRNYGIGGYGVYQAYRRMLRMEDITPADYVVLNIWGLDDHFRSLDAWRGPRCLDWFRQPGHENMFHGNPWVHVRIDESSGEVVERDNVCPTPESLYNLCDPDWVYDLLADDVMLHLHLAAFTDYDVPTHKMQALADVLGVSAKFGTDDKRQAAQTVQTAAGLKASQYILRKAQDYCDANGKKFVVLLSYDLGRIMDACNGKPRPDQPLLDFMADQGIAYADSMSKHAEEFATFRLSARDYVNRYYIGHYNPAGNHFFAFAVKQALVDWLNPKPLPYRITGTTVDYREYLPAT